MGSVWKVLVLRTCTHFPGCGVLLEHISLPQKQLRPELLGKKAGRPTRKHPSAEHLLPTVSVPKLAAMPSVDTSAHHWNTEWKMALDHAFAVTGVNRLAADKEVEIALLEFARVFNEISLKGLCVCGV